MLGFGRVAVKININAFELQVVQVGALALGLILGKAVRGLNLLHDHVIGLVIGEGSHDGHDHGDDRDDDADLLLFAVLRVVRNSVS